MRRRSYRVDIEIGRLFFQRDITILISIAAAKKRHRHWDRQIAKIIPAIDGDNLGQSLLCGLVHASAIQPRINKSAKTDMGDQAGTPGGDLAHQLHDHAAGQHIRLNLIVPRHLLHARRPDPVAPYDTSGHADMRKPVHPAFLPVADTKRMYAGQVSGMFRGKEPALYSGVKRTCLNQTTTTTGQSDYGAVLDHRGSLVRGQKLNLRHLTCS